MYTIYLFKNKINNKSYVGLTNNLERRIIEHRCHKKKTKFSYAIRKYGIDNFDLLVLKDGIKTKKEASTYEQKYIEEYNSAILGYNMTEGGEVGSGCRGIKSPNAKITEEQAKYIFNSDISSSELARKMGISCGIIHNIRSGRSWKHVGDAPTPAKNNNFILDEKQVMDILQTDSTNNEMSKKYNVAPDVISKIRRGITWKHLDRSNIPVYKKYKLTQTQKEEILDSKDSNVILAKKYGVTRQAIRQLKLIAKAI